MSCLECGWPEPFGRCACCGHFIGPVYLRTSEPEEYSPEREEEEE